MSNAKRYRRTDMALEACTDEERSRLSGVEAEERHAGGFTVTEIRITGEEGARALGKPVGKYITVALGRASYLTDGEREAAVSLISSEIKGLLFSEAPPRSVLVAGLGNRYIISDAVGPLTVKGITANRHIRESDPELYRSLKSREICTVVPGVSAETGLEALELIKGALEASGAEAVIVIDALASRSTERLATTVQLSNTGIMPGSGIGNRRLAIDKSTLGVPVISVGVPTVVDSSTLVSDMLERAGITDIPQSLESELENGRSFFVTLKDADAAVNDISSLLASAIQRSLML